MMIFFFFSSRRRHTRCSRDWSSDVCSSDLSAHEAVNRVAQAIIQGQTRIIDLDLRAYFDNVQHSLLLEKVARRIQDASVMKLLKMILKSTGTKGVPQGGVISPVLSNVYLTERS